MAVASIVQRDRLPRRRHPAPGLASAGAGLLAGADRRLLRDARSTAVRQSDLRLRAARAVARSDPWLRRYPVARARRLLRRGRLHGRPAGVPRLARAAFGSRCRCRRRRRFRLRGELPGGSRRGSDAPDGHAGDRAAHRRGGQPAVVDHRWRRRARGHAGRDRVRHVPLRSRRDDGASSTASRSWRRCSCSRAGSSTRPSVSRCAASARTRGACPPSARTSTAACGRCSRSRPRWRAWRARCWRRPRASSASTRSASSAPPSCSSSWRSAARAACTARCWARPCSSWRRTCSPALAPSTGSSGWVPCS